jgi:cytoskeletal protein RodZ
MIQMLYERRKASLMVTIAIVTLVLAVVPAVITSDNFFAFAHSCDDHDHDHDDESEENDNSNEAVQSISQEQSSEQNSQVVSGEDSIASGNNVGLFFNDNIGNLALGQQ